MRVVCPHCLSVNSLPKKESYAKANCGKCKKSLLDTAPLELTSATFDEVVVNSDIPVLIDFWAPWCGPCKMMAPNFTNAAKSFALKTLFTKVNTEDEGQLGTRFGIRSIPTLILFRDGKEIERVSGALSEQQLISLVNKYI